MLDECHSCLWSQVGCEWNARILKEWWVMTDGRVVDESNMKVKSLSRVRFFVTPWTVA